MSQSNQLRFVFVSFIVSVMTAALHALPDNQQLLVEQWRADLRRNPVAAEHAAESLEKMGDAACRTALPELVSALQYDEDSVARALMPAILKAGSSAVIPLERSLSDSNFFVRQRAAQILGQFGPAAKRAADELAQRLLDPKVEVQTAAEKALVAIGPEAVPSISALLRQADEPTRKPVVRILGQFGAAGVAPILDRLKSDESPYIRTVAAEALGQLNSPSPLVVRGLTIATSDLDEGVRGAAVDALAALGSSAQASFGRLIVMAHEDKDGLVRQKASEALLHLGKLSTESLPGLVNALHHPSAACREDAARLIGGSAMTFAEAQPALTAALKDEEVAVRVQGIQSASLLSQQTPETSAWFQSALSDAQPQVRSAAVQALGKHVGSSDAARALGTMLKDPNPALRRETIQALGKLGVSAVPQLVNALEDPYSLLGDEAAARLVAVGFDAIPVLEEAAQGASPVVKGKIDGILKKIGRARTKGKGRTH